MDNTFIEIKEKKNIKLVHGILEHRMSFSIPFPWLEKHLIVREAKRISREGEWVSEEALAPPIISKCT